VALESLRLFDRTSSPEVVLGASGATRANARLSMIWMPRLLRGGRGDQDLSTDQGSDEGGSTNQIDGRAGPLGAT
jgi:hypothetical protein